MKEPCHPTQTTTDVLSLIPMLTPFTAVEKLSGENYVLRAKVENLEKDLSLSRSEMEYYSGIATELAADLKELSLSVGDTCLDITSMYSKRQFEAMSAGSIYEKLNTLLLMCRSTLEKSMDLHTKLRPDPRSGGAQKNEGSCCRSSTEKAK